MVLRASLGSCAAGVSVIVAGAAVLAVGCRNWDFYYSRLGHAATSTGGGAATTSSTTDVATNSSSTSSSTSTATASASGTASTSSSAATGGCGGVNNLSDTFPGADPNGNWSASVKGGATIAEMNNQLVATLPTSMTSSYANYGSARYYDLEEGDIAVEVPSAGNTATTAEAQLSIQQGGGTGNYVEFTQEKGTLSVARKVNGAYATLKSAPYDPVANLYWRVRESAGVTYFDTSSDGTTWDPFVQAATATLFPMNLVQIVLNAATQGGEVNPGTVAFANVVGGPGVGKWCSVSSISDDFMSTTRGDLWYRSYATAPETATQGGGTLVFTLVSNDTKSAAYHSSASYDLTGGAAFVHAPVVPNPTTSAQIVFELIGTNNDSLLVVEDKGTIYFRSNVGGTKSDVSLLYDATAHAWWRIGESGGNVLWDTSPDGKIWTNQRKLAVPFPVDELDVELTGGTYIAEASPGTAQFSSFNIAPP